VDCAFATTWGITQLLDATPNMWKAAAVNAIAALVFALMPPLARVAPLSAMVTTSIFTYAYLFKLRDLGGGPQTGNFALHPRTNPRLKRGFELLQVDKSQVSLAHPRAVSEQKLARFRFELRLIELLLRETPRIGASAETFAASATKALP